MNRSIIAIALLAATTGCANAAVDLATVTSVFEAAKTTVSDVKNAVEAEKATLAKKYICEDIRMKDWQDQFGQVANEWNAVCTKKAAPALPKQ